MQTNFKNFTTLAFSLMLVMGFYSCAKKADTVSSSSTTGSTTSSGMPQNSLYFDSLMKNVVVHGESYNGFWQMGSTSFMKYTGNTSVSLVFRFPAKPTAGKYKAVFRDPKAGECYFWVNYIDGANSSTYGTADTGKYVTVTMLNGKVNASMESTNMGGNRGGVARVGWANVTDQ